MPSPRLRPTSRKPRRAPTPPLDAGPAEVMKYLSLDGGAEWKTMGASPLAAAHELLDGDDNVDDCAVCGGSLRTFQPADDDEGPFAMSPPKTVAARAAARPRDRAADPRAGCVVAHGAFAFFFPLTVMTVLV